jgi:hypothetical protein
VKVQRNLIVIKLTTPARKLIRKQLSSCRRLKLSFRTRRRSKREKNIDRAISNIMAENN